MFRINKNFNLIKKENLSKSRKKQVKQIYKGEIKIELKINNIKNNEIEKNKGELTKKISYFFCIALGMVSYVYAFLYIFMVNIPVVGYSLFAIGTIAFIFLVLFKKTNNFQLVLYVGIFVLNATLIILVYLTGGLNPHIIYWLFVLPPIFLSTRFRKGIISLLLFFLIVIYILCYLELKNFNFPNLITVPEMDVVNIYSFILTYSITNMLIIFYGITLKNSEEKIKEAYQRIKIQNDRLKEQSIIDGLTGVYNHRYFQQRLRQEIDRAARNNSTVGLIIADIDYFKHYNDTYGHQFGDETLSSLASTLKNGIRNSDILARYGGEEFCIIVPDTPSEGVRQLADRLHEKVNELNLTPDHQSKLQLTMSFGISIYPTCAQSVDQLVSQADEALYHAKNMGRNKVILYQEAIKKIKKTLTNPNPKHNSLLFSFKSLLDAISINDRYTLGHSERVTRYAMDICQALKISDQKLDVIKLASYLHDIGKIWVPASILMKTDSLNEHELNLMQKHPIYAVNMLKELENIPQVLHIIKHHHERFDGKGYPDQISEDKIPLGARIISVADAFDSMISDRPHRNCLTYQEAIQELNNNAGLQFDPLVVKTFIELFNSRQLTEPSIYIKEVVY